jgi:hypothetical protein
MMIVIFWVLIRATRCHLPEDDNHHKVLIRATRCHLLEDVNHHGSYKSHTVSSPRR